jgi:hypothetical protein
MGDDGAVLRHDILRSGQVVFRTSGSATATVEVEIAAAGSGAGVVHREEPGATPLPFRAMQAVATIGSPAQGSDIEEQNDDEQEQKDIHDALLSRHDRGFSDAGEPADMFLLPVTTIGWNRLQHHSQ